MKSVITGRALRALLHSLIPRARIVRVLVAVAFAAFFTAACGDSTGPSVAATVTISPTSATLVVGGTQQFTAVVKNSKGNVLKVNPIWAVTSGGGSITSTGLFTAPLVPGTSTISVSCSGVTATATVTVNAGAAATIAVLPQTVTLFPGGTQQFTAVVKDGSGNVLNLTPVWTVPNPPGTIISNTGFFTAGSTLGSFPNTVSACVNVTLCDQADVIVISPPAPPALRGFTVLARQAVTCTNGSINGDVGTFQAAPTGSITQTTCPITAGTPQVGTAASIAAYNNYLTAYAARAPQPGDCDVAHTLAGSLAGVTLAPGVYCFTAAASLTGLLTLNGPPTGLWLFKIGTSGTGGLTGNSFTVLMAGGAQACNVTWWVAQAAAMTDSFFKGTILAGAGITLTRTDQIGNTWAGASGVGDVTFTGPGNPVIGCP